MEKDPAESAQALSLRALLPSRLPDLSPETVATAQKTLQQIYRFVRNRRPLTKSFFQAFDITKCGQMPPAHFRATVSSHYGGSALTEEMLQCLSQYFTDPSTNDVRYLDFLNDIEEHTAQKSDSDGTNNNNNSNNNNEYTDGSTTRDFGRTRTRFMRTAEKPALPEFRPQAKAPDVDVLLERLKLQALRERARLSEFMKYVNK